jgi:hypothetical protein
MVGIKPVEIGDPEKTQQSVWISEVLLDQDHVSVNTQTDSPMIATAIHSQEPLQLLNSKAIDCMQILSGNDANENYHKRVAVDNDKKLIAIPPQLRLVFIPLYCL